MAHRVRDPQPASRPSKDFAGHHDTVKSHPRLARPRNEVGAQGNESEDYLNETSPLLSPKSLENEQLTEGGSRTPSGLLELNEGDEEQSKSVWYLFLLTLSIGG